MHPDIQNMFDLTGKIALVTGGAKNLGFDAASALCAAGCNVAITSRNLSDAQQAAEKLQGIYDVQVLPLELEHGNFAQVCSAATKIHGEGKHRHSCQ